MVDVRINEIFYSIQGEGIYAGEPMTFVRFQGCPWDCVWCDSRRTWDSDPGAGQTMWIEDVVKEVKRTETRWVCITGGEPLAQPRAFGELVTQLHRDGIKIEVETSGLNPFPRDPTFSLVDCWTPDVKLQSAKLSNGKPHLESISRLREQDQLKFVVSKVRDLEEIDGMKPEDLTPATILVSPVLEWEPGYEHFWLDSSDRGDGAASGLRTSTAWWRQVADYCKDRHYRLSLQVHKMIWGDIPGV